MILFLDTTDLNKILLALVDKGSKRPIKKTVKIPYHESHKTLEHLDNFLRTNKIVPPLAKGRQGGVKKLTTDNLLLSTIILCSGHGSFTGIRVGASLAKALGFAWNIPIRAIPKEKVPKDLRDLAKLKAGKKIVIDYGRPAV